MADEPTDEDLSKLELPSLRLPGLGRRNKRADRAQERRDEPVDPVETRPEPVQATSPGAPLVRSRPRSGPEPRAARTRTMPALPTPSGRLAAAVTGLVVGAVGAALTYLSLRGCEAAKGTESCGGTGVPLLLVILALMVLVGSAVLGAWGVAEARSTSVLGVGVLCVILLVALIEDLFSGWMFLVVPILAALSYAVAHWVTTALVEPQPDPGPQHDVR
jgi:hypothetical protein